MIRVIKQSGKYYGIKVDISDEEEIESITIFAKEGTPVIIVESLDDLRQINIHDDVEMIED